MDFSNDTTDKIVIISVLIFIFLLCLCLTRVLYKLYKQKGCRSCSNEFCGCNIFDIPEETYSLV